MEDFICLVLNVDLIYVRNFSGRGFCTNDKCQVFVNTLGWGKHKLLYYVVIYILKMKKKIPP